MLEALEREAYYDLLAASPDARFHQSWDYEAARTDGCRFEAVHVGGVATALVRIRTTPVLPRGLAYVYFGPAFATPAAPSAQIQEVLVALREEYAGRRRLLLRVVPPLQPALAQQFRDALTQCGYRALAGVADYRTILLDLDADLDAIKSGFKKRLRYGVNRAGRNGFEIEEGTTLDLYDRFLALYDDMWERKQFATGVDPQWIRTVQGQLPDRFKLRVRVARLGDQDMAATVHAHVGDTVLYLLGATRVETEQPPERQYAAHCLHWDVIESAVAAGTRWYDLGGIDPEANPGGYAFKDAFGGDDVTGLGAWEVGGAIGSRIVVGVGAQLRQLRAQLRQRRVRS
ncbi:MAG: GNAT family N-acetyltransferase [Planctomycetota bacterium]